MRGEILTFDEAANTGLISGDDGLRYGFNSADIQSGSAAVGKRVDFVAQDGQATHVMILAETQAPSAFGSAASTEMDRIDWMHLMFKFDGRIRRSHFGMAWLILFVAGFVVGWIPLLGTLLSIALLWPNLAIAVKRLHDMGRSGWFAAIPYAAVLIGSIVAFIMVGAAAFMNVDAFENEDALAMLAILGPALGIFGLVSLIGLGFLLWIGLTPGQPGSNRFGNNPKGE